MFGIDSSEFLLVAFVALIVIGPKDLPKALRVAGYWVGRARGIARQFRSGFDQMVREAELEEMEKKWRAENERIMREHPAEAYLPKVDAGQAGAAPDDAANPVMTARPVIVDHPEVTAAPSGAAPRRDEAAS